MELSRFNRAIEQIATDYTANGIEADLASLAANLSSLASNPGSPTVSQAFKDQLNSFRTKLSESSLNQADGELSEVIASHGLTMFVGNGLFQTIKDVLNENQLTPNLAAIEIEKVRVATTEKMSAVVAIDNAFTKLEVEYYRLEEGESEMLVNLPIEPETKTLDDLAKEAKDWNQICRAVSETFDHELDPVTIKAVGSGSILLYMAAVPAFIYGVAKCLKGVNLILAEVIKMKTIYTQLVETKAPEAVLKGLEQHQSGKAKIDLEQLASVLVDEHYRGTDQGRKNELKNSLSISLQRLSQKLATGTKVNLRLTPPAKPKLVNGEEPTQEQKNVLQSIEQFEKVQIEIDASRAALDYKAHATELIAGLPAPEPEVKEVDN